MINILKYFLLLVIFTGISAGVYLFINQDKELLNDETPTNFYYISAEINSKNGLTQKSQEEAVSTVETINTQERLSDQGGEVSLITQVAHEVEPESKENIRNIEEMFPVEGSRPDVVHVELAIELTFNDVTGEYITNILELEEYLDVFPETVFFEDNTRDPKKFCIWTEFKENKNGKYFAASELGKGYMQERPTLSLCNGYYYPSRDMSVFDYQYNLDTVFSVKSVQLAVELKLDQETLFYPTSKNALVSSLLKEYPEEVIFEDNSSNPSFFCVWAELTENKNGKYFVASELGKGYMQERPTLSLCNDYYYPPEEKSNISIISLIKRIQLDMELKLDQETLFYPTDKNMLESLDHRQYPDWIVFEDNSDNPFIYCVWSELFENKNGKYFSGSTEGGGYTNIQPTLNNCLTE